MNPALRLVIKGFIPEGMISLANLPALATGTIWFYRHKNKAQEAYFKFLLHTMHCAGIGNVKRSVIRPLLFKGEVMET